MFTFEGKEYRIVGRKEGNLDSGPYQVYETDVERVRSIFAWRPWWVGNKFRFLKRFELRQRLEFVRYSDFDSGWSFQYYWKKWNKRWEDIEIL
jgi:hypothetical protein